MLCLRLQNTDVKLHYTYNTIIIIDRLTDKITIIIFDYILARKKNCRLFDHVREMVII